MEAAEGANSAPFGGSFVGSIPRLPPAATATSPPSSTAAAGHRDAERPRDSRDSREGDRERDRHDGDR